MFLPEVSLSLTPVATTDLGLRLQVSITSDMTPSAKVRSERIPSAKRLRMEELGTGSDGEEKDLELEELDGGEIGLVEE